MAADPHARPGVHRGEQARVVRLEAPGPAYREFCPHSKIPAERNQGKKKKKKNKEKPPAMARARESPVGADRRAAGPARAPPPPVPDPLAPPGGAGRRRELAPLAAAGSTGGPGRARSLRAVGPAQLPVPREPKRVGDERLRALMAVGARLLRESAQKVRVWRSGAARRRPQPRPDRGCQRQEELLARSASSCRPVPRNVAWEKGLGGSASALRVLWCGSSLGLQVAASKNGFSRKRRSQKSRCEQLRKSRVPPALSEGV